jgi:hypothetical protein
MLEWMTTSRTPSANVRQSQVDASRPKALRLMRTVSNQRKDTVPVASWPRRCTTRLVQATRLAL